MPFYAVKNGRVPGIYETWKECEAQVSGFSGAQFKKFYERQDAEKYMNTDNYSQKIEEGNINQTPEEFFESLPKDAINIFIDGSFNSVDWCCGAGVYIVNYGKEPIVLSEEIWDNTSMRNVCGEIRAAEIAMKWAINNNVKNIIIYYDYMGVAKWCTGEWKTTKERTKAYVEFYKEISRFVNIKFVRVKGHSGNPGNEAADKIAKKAAGIY